MRFCSLCALWIAILATGIGFFPANAAADELVIIERPLTWQEARIPHGEGLYAELCAVCHGQGGKGDGPAVPALEQTPPDLTTVAVRNKNVFPHDKLERAIAGRARIDVHGTIGMPIWGLAFRDARPEWQWGREQFAKRQIHEIVEYLESLQVG